MGAWVATAVSEIASHVHYLGAYEGVQVTNLIQKGFLLQLCFRNTEVHQMHPYGIYTLVCIDRK